MSVTVVLIIVAAVLALFVGLLYNSLIGKRNQVDSVFSTIDVMLTKRYDLLPNLVAAVKGYMTYEKETLEQITDLRTRALGSRTVDEKVAIDNQIAGAIRQLIVSVENYPQLRASENVLQLQASLNEIEEQLSAARRAFNAAVLEYNNAIEMFPTNLLAGIMNFRRRTFFEVAQEVRQPVRISL